MGNFEQAVKNVQKSVGTEDLRKYRLSRIHERVVVSNTSDLRTGCASSDRHNAAPEDCSIKAVILVHASRQYQFHPYAAELRYHLRGRVGLFLSTVVEC